MAGIAAILSTEGRPVSPAEINAVIDAGRHLGTEAPRTRLDGPLALGHVALPCLPAAETEPQPLGSPDDRLHVTADLRLDNRADLMATLGLRASEDAPLDDARILLAAYDRWGAQMPAHLVGDFAFVLWDARARLLLAARDGLGVRPLCVSQAGGLLLLASEAQMIVAHPAVQIRLDLVAAAGWLANRYTDRRTLFEGVTRLAPGHLLVVRPVGQQIRRHWDLGAAPPIRYRRPAEYAAHLRDLLTRCVADRLRTSGSGVGTYVSGGLDSTTVTALAARLAPRRGLEVAPLHWSFPHLPSCHETPWAQAVARHHGLDLITVDARDYWQLDDLHRTPPAQEEPGEMFDSLQVASLPLLRARGANVLLTGVGGDHLTNGTYLANGERFWRGHPAVLTELWAWARWAEAPYGETLLRNLVRPSLPPPLLRAARRALGRPEPWPWPPWLKRDAVARLHLAEELGEAPARLRGRRSLAEHHWQITAPNLAAFCRREQRLGARFGVEVRHPFVDTRLAGFALGIPPDLWIRRGYAKWLLREATHGLLPTSLRYRMEKPHFHAYYAVGFQGEFQKVRALLRNQRLVDTGLYCYHEAEKAYDTYRKTPSVNANPRIYSPVMLALWMETQRHLS